MNKRWIISIISLVIIGVTITIFFSPLTNANKGNSAKYSGIVQQTEYDLSFKIGGRVESLTVHEGDYVYKGQLLGELEQGEWLAKVEQAQAAVELAQANLDKAMRSVGLTEQDSLAKINQAQAALNMAQAKYEALQNGPRKEEIAQLEMKVQLAKEAYSQAEHNVQRMNQLFEHGAIPQTTLDEVTLQFEQAKTQLTTAQLELEMAVSGARPEELEAAKQQVEQARAALQEALNGSGKVELSQADVRLARAQYKQALASLQEAETYFSYTKLIAPIDGIVSGRYVEASEMVNAGLSALTLVDPQDKWVIFYIPETELTNLAVNQEVLISLHSIEQEVTGKIAYINPAPQFAIKKATNYLSERDIRSFAIKVQLLENVDKIYAGMTAEWMGVK